jgi:hypothetical protein
MEDSEQRKSSNSAPLLVTTACVLLLFGIFGVAYEANKSAQAPSAPGHIYMCICMCVMPAFVIHTHTHTRTHARARARSLSLSLSLREGSGHIEQPAPAPSDSRPPETWIAQPAASQTSIYINAHTHEDTHTHNPQPLKQVFFKVEDIYLCKDTTSSHRPFTTLLQTFSK